MPDFTWEEALAISPKTRERSSQHAAGNNNSPPPNKNHVKYSIDREPGLRFVALSKVRKYKYIVYIIS